MGREDWLNNLSADEEEILFKAAEEPAIVEAVNRFNQRDGNKIEMIRTLRKLLVEIFPEIAQLSPARHEIKYGDANRVFTYVSPPLSGEFRITRALIALLLQESEAKTEGA